MKHCSCIYYSVCKKHLCLSEWIWDWGEAGKSGAEIKRMLGPCKPLAGEKSPSLLSHIQDSTDATWEYCASGHTCTHTTKPQHSDLCTETLAHDNIWHWRPSSENFSPQSDVRLVYGAVGADSSDVGLIHQCQQTISHRVHIQTNGTTHRYKCVSIFLIPIELFWPSTPLTSLVFPGFYLHEGNRAHLT